MVASGVSVLAVVALIAQVSACPLSCGSYSGDYLGYGSGVVQTGVVEAGVVDSGVVGTAGFVGTTGFVGTPVQERSASGTYQVALDNNGPSSTRRLPVIRTHSTAPTVQRPTVRIPYSIPGPRTVSNSCRCVKTIVKPQVVEQIVSVPSVQRYIQTTSRPVVERIHYNAVPVNSGASEIGVVASGVADVAASAPAVSAYGYGVADVAEQVVGGYTAQAVVDATPVVASPVVATPVVATPVVATPVVASRVVEATYPVVRQSCTPCL